MTPSPESLYAQTYANQPSFPLVPSKVCTICKTPKSLDDFYRSNKKYGDGRQSHCKTCAPEYHIKWCEKRKERLDKIAEDKASIRVCSSCGIPQPLVNFEKNIGGKNGRRSVCNSCVSPIRKKWRDSNRETIRSKAKVDAVRKKYMKQWYQDHKEEQKEMLKEWHKLYPDYDKKRWSDSRRFKQFGTTPQWYEKTLNDQHRACAICGSTDPKGFGKVFAIDHNHNCCGSTKACDKCRRGLLCSVCNTMLGILEKTEWVRQAKSYLNKYRLKDEQDDGQGSLFDL